MSLRTEAKQLGISSAYLSYMINGKRPWRADIYARYRQLAGGLSVNKSVNTQPSWEAKIDTWWACTYRIEPVPKVI